MMDSVTLRSARRKLACLGLTVSLAAVAQPTAAPPSVPAALPRPPHQVAPDAPIQPDYYALAMSHTSLVDDPQWRPLHLRTPGRRGDPTFIVLPVQTQAYGFSPTFRALLGARLDQELQRRHVDASRQTDIVDWRGPFVRRTDDATVAALAAEHPGATLLALYLGHDANGHAFLGLSRTSAGTVRVAHRRVDMPLEEVATLDGFTAILPALLAELGLGAPRPGAPLAAGRDGHCEQSDWALADPPSDAPPDQAACHALLMGTLLPDFQTTLERLSQPNSPDRLAWLARAWVESSALADKAPAMRSVAALAAFQLRLDPKVETAAAQADDSDVVVQPLARTLWARDRTRSMPQSSRNAAARAYVRSAAQGLPPFAAAVIEERGSFEEAFRRVDLCPMQLALPHFRTPAGCEDADTPDPAPRQPASLAESQLVDAWRVAVAWSELYVEGEMRGSASGIAQVLHDIPPRVAAHPFVREMHFVVQPHERLPRDADSHLEAVRARLQDYAGAVATLQRNDVVIVTHPVGENATLPVEQRDPAIQGLKDDIARLAVVVDLDFHGVLLRRPEVDPKQPAFFLVDGSFEQAQLLERMRALSAAGRVAPPWTASPGMAAASAPAPVRQDAPARAMSLEIMRLEPPSRMPTKEQLQHDLESAPTDMTAHIGLALLALEHGDGVAEARRIIDARRTHSRVEDSLGETEAWAEAGHLFFFAGEFGAAREYYARAVSRDDGSESDMMARVRLALIDGNMAGARAETHRRLERYDSDGAAADEAAWLFMRGEAGPAWTLIQSRIQTSEASALWRVALAGQRIGGRPLAALPDWIVRNKLQEAQLPLAPAIPSWLNAYAMLDRLPVQPDAASRASMAPADPQNLWAHGLRAIGAAMGRQPDADVTALSQDVMAASFASQGLLPFLSWDLWTATNGAEPSLQQVRTMPREAGFPMALAKAMVSAADGHRDDALRSLTAARYELGRYGTAYASNDEMLTGPYDFVLASWLMSRQTGEPAYAQQGLAIARAYQRVQPYMGWPYAAEALLSKDAKARELAACRAQRLDAASMFLHESGLHPDPKSATCRKATTW